MKGAKTMTRTKENAISDFMEMISHSWTWNRLTEDEKQRFSNSIYSTKVKGNYSQRWEVLHGFYSFFLEGVGYKPIGWRETDENAPQF